MAAGYGITIPHTEKQENIESIMDSIGETTIELRGVVSEITTLRQNLLGGDDEEKVPQGTTTEPKTFLEKLRRTNDALICIKNDLQLETKRIIEGFQQ